MVRGVRRWHRVTGFAAAACLLTAAVASSTQFTPLTDRTRGILEGHWESCRESDGHYGERVYDNTLPGIGPFELHLGPYHEFALFRGIQDEHRAHESTDNLLRPFNVEVQSNRASHSWEAGGLKFQVALGGGSRADCESWYLSLTRSTSNSQ
jgi:hypothetical protein